MSVNSVVAVKAEDENFDYYLLKVTSCPEILKSTEEDSWGVTYPSGFHVFRGYYYDKLNRNPLTYKLVTRKIAIVPALSLVYICADVVPTNKITLSEDTHLDILAILDDLD